MSMRDILHNMIGDIPIVHDGTYYDDDSRMSSLHDILNNRCEIRDRLSYIVQHNIRRRSEGDDSKHISMNGDSTVMRREKVDIDDDIFNDEFSKYDDTTVNNKYVGIVYDDSDSDSDNGNSERNEVKMKYI